MEETAEEIPCYSQTTNDIVVNVSPLYVDERSEPENGVFAFAYTVVMVNEGVESVQLVNRHWVVKSAGVQLADVKGEGVIGEQPILHPGTAYEYTSWTLIHDPIGEMFGSYTFVNDDGDFFDVEIPKFDLVFYDDQTIH